MTPDIAKFQREYYAALKRGDKRGAATRILQIVLAAVTIAERDGIEDALFDLMDEIGKKAQANRIAKEVADL